MSRSVLATKLNIPRTRPGWVLRRHLLERLDSGRPRKLILTSAPAGFGKTTLLSQWHASQPDTERRFAVVRLDEEDNDPLQFWRYVLAALDGVRPGLTDGAHAMLCALPPPGAGPHDGRTRFLYDLLTTLVNSLATAQAGDGSSASRPLVLALDDYHVIREPAIHSSLAHFLDYLPATIQVAILTRADPPLPLARLRARDQLLELRAADLRLSSAETELFLTRLMALDLPAEAISTLEARTEGWPAGLHLAALSLQGLNPEQSRAFVQAFAGTHRHVLSFLTEEVLQRQSPEAQSFLLETSILDYLAAPLCDAVTDRPGSQAMLERLTNDNVFIAPLDAEGQWYRYHGLFADVLRTRLQESSPERLSVLHARAAAWHEAQGAVADAVRHALAAGDPERAARLVEDGYRRLAMHGELGALNHWLDALPSELIQMRPKLRWAYALALAYSGRRQLFQVRLDETEQALQAAAAPGEADVTRCEAAALRAVFASLYWAGPHAMDLAWQAFRLLPGDGSDDALWLRVLTLQALGNCHRLAGEVHDAERCYGESLLPAQALQSQFLIEAVTNRLSQNALLKGGLHRGAQTLNAALCRAESRGGGPLWFTGELHIHLGRIYTEWDDLETALQHMERGIEISREVENELALLEGYLGLAEVQVARRQMDGAATALDRAEQIAMDAGGCYLPGQVAAWRAWLSLCGTAGEATCWAADLAERRARFGLDELPLVLREFQDLVLARFWLMEGRLDQALELLAGLEAAAQRAGRTHMQLAALVWRTVGLSRCGDLASARDTLTRSLETARPEGYVRTFVDAGSVMRELLAEVRSTMTYSHEPPGPSLVYLDHLLAAFPGDCPGPQARSPLTCREMETLALIAAGASNQDIADQLVVTVGTVKIHVNHILDKLQARNRTQAVARARELQLL